MMLADVVVNPSIVPEGFGRTPVEAQAMGRPVIVSRLGALQETILDGQTGWMVEAADPIALAKALDNALNLTAEERFAIANTAIAHVRQNYSMEQMCWSTLDVYAEAYGRPVPWESAAA
jgi:glycosyltransferase involved in cell wall biosynthesis